MRDLLRHMAGAAILHPRIYFEIREEPASWFQSILIVLLAALSAAYVSNHGQMSHAKLIWSCVAAIVSWVIFGCGIMVGGVLMRRFDTQDIKLKQALAMIGFAATPMMLTVLALIPPINQAPGIFWIWAMASLLMAIRQILMANIIWVLLDCAFAIFVFMLFDIGTGGFFGLLTTGS